MFVIMVLLYQKICSLSREKCEQKFVIFNKLLFAFWGELKVKILKNIKIGGLSGVCTFVYFDRDMVFDCKITQISVLDFLGFNLKNNSFGFKLSGCQIVNPVKTGKL